MTSTFVSKSDERKCGDAKKRKKTEHTRMYAQLCSSVNTIFTSVVVYSRTTVNTKQKKKINNELTTTLVIYFGVYGDQ